MRVSSDSFDISSENSATVLAGSSGPLSIAMCCATFNANDVLPMAGRAAMMISSPPCMPVVISSSFRNGPESPCTRRLGSRNACMPPA